MKSHFSSLNEKPMHYPQAPHFSGSGAYLPISTVIPSALSLQPYALSPPSSMSTSVASYPSFSGVAHAILPNHTSNHIPRVMYPSLTVLPVSNHEFHDVNRPTSTTLIAYHTPKTHTPAFLAGTDSQLGDSSGRTSPVTKPTLASRGLRSEPKQIGSMAVPVTLEKAKMSQFCLVDEFIAHHSAQIDDERDGFHPYLGDLEKQEWKWKSWTPDTLGSPASMHMIPDGSSVDSSSSDSTDIELSLPENASATDKTQKLHPTRCGHPRLASKSRKKKVHEHAASEAGPSVSSEIPKSTRRSNNDRRNQSTTEKAAFVCQHPDCGKPFTRAYNLISHMRTHNSERPFSCQHCNRQFARQHDRNRHAKLHLGTKPFSCTKCNKSFARRDALSRHLRLERGCGDKRKV